jgi:hypothetical protein
MSSSPSSSPVPHTEKGISSYADPLNESVHTVDDVDIRDIESVSRDFIVVKRGFVNIQCYYIPLSKVEGWDDNKFLLKITEEQVKRRYERDRFPDPNKYHIKDYPYYNTAYYHRLTMIPTKYPADRYGNLVKAYKIYECDLYNRSLASEERLSEHVEKEHSWRIVKLASFITMTKTTAVSNKQTFTRKRTFVFCNYCYWMASIMPYTFEQTNTTSNYDTCPTCRENKLFQFPIHDHQELNKGDQN